jgi:hypothetical protein
MPGLLEINHTWTSTGGTSGGLTPVYLDFGASQSALYISHSTLATTNSVSLQSAPASTGPWAIEASTGLSSGASTTVVLRLTGPYGWARPYLHTVSTGDYTIRLVGVS